MYPASGVSKIIRRHFSGIAATIAGEQSSLQMLIRPAVSGTSGQTLLSTLAPSIINPSAEGFHQP
jgi:hypothetical protein